MLKSLFGLILLTLFLIYLLYNTGHALLSLSKKASSSIHHEQIHTQDVQQFFTGLNNK